MHATSYQFGYCITPEALKRPERIFKVIDAITCLAEVGGNHSRFLYDFSPEAIIFRWSDDPAPRILFGYALDEDRRIEHLTHMFGGKNAKL